MKNIRTWECWEWEAFGNRKAYYSMPLALIAIFWGLGGFVLGIPVAVFMEVVLGIMPPWSVLTMTVLMPLIAMSTGPQLYKISGTHSIPKDDNFRWDLKSRAEEYYKLSKADRRDYPDNIIKLLKDPDLTGTQRRELDHQMSVIHDKIVKRNKLRDEITRRTVDITPVVEQLEQARRYLDSDIETYSKQ